MNGINLSIKRICYTNNDGCRRSPVDYEGLSSFSCCFLPHSCPHTKFSFEKPKLEPFALSFPFSFFLSTAFFRLRARNSISCSVSWSVGWSVGLSVCRSVAEGSEHATFCYFVHCMILFSVSTLLFGFMDFF